MNTANLIVAENFQAAWFKAIKYLSENKWSAWSLVIQIKDVNCIDAVLNEQIIELADNLKIYRPKKVAYTIFPYGSYREDTSQDRLYEKYTRYYNAVKHKLTWGTYFDRMIAYPGVNGETNQLKNIIHAINTREKSMQAAYTIVIEIPGNETTKPLGAPCLNYLAVQIDNLTNTVNLLATYRNHDFLQKAYGNYYGLCKLLLFLAKETNKKTGYLTCVSSHAYIDRNKTELLKLIEAQ